MDELDPLWVAIGKQSEREEIVLRWLEGARHAVWMAEQELKDARAKKNDLLDRKLRRGRYAQEP